MPSSSLESRDRDGILFLRKEIVRWYLPCEAGIFLVKQKTLTHGYIRLYRSLTFISPAVEGAITITWSATL